MEIGQMSRLNVRCLPIYTHSVELYINNRILKTRFIKVDPNDCKMPLKFKTVTMKALYDHLQDKQNCTCENSTEKILTHSITWFDS